MIFKDSKNLKNWRKKFTKKNHMYIPKIHMNYIFNPQIVFAVKIQLRTPGNPKIPKQESFVVLYLCKSSLLGEIWIYTTLRQLLPL